MLTELALCDCFKNEAGRNPNECAKPQVYLENPHLLARRPTIRQGARHWEQTSGLTPNPPVPSRMGRGFGVKGHAGSRTGRGLGVKGHAGAAR